MLFYGHARNWADFGEGLTNETSSIAIKDYLQDNGSTAGMLYRAKMSKCGDALFNHVQAKFGHIVSPAEQAKQLEDALRTPKGEHPPFVGTLNGLATLFARKAELTPK